MIIEIIITSSLLAIMFSLLGLFVILRKMSFIGTGLSHSAFGGAGIGLLLNKDYILSSIIYTAFIGQFIENIETHLSRDSAIGIIFSFSMALGLLSLFLSNSYVNIFSLLMGSLGGINTYLMILVIIMFIVFLFYFAREWKNLYYTSFDPIFSKVKGINNERVERLFLLILSITIVLAMKLVGILLLSSFLIVPPATALLLRKNIHLTMILSILFSLISVWSGIGVSYVYDLPLGVSIVLISILLFTIVFIIRKINKHKI